MKKIAFIGILMLLFACNTPTDNSTPPDEQRVVDSTNSTEAPVKLPKDEANFLAFYTTFVKAIESKDAAAFNSFIDEVFGLYVIESNGAMPSFKRVNDINKFKTVRGEQFFELKLSEINTLPTFEELPKIICDAQPYDKQGCFAQKLNLLANDEFWYYTDLNEKEKQAISAFAEKIDFTAINTSVGKFYFTLSEDTWKIAFIDLRTPCEA